MKRSIANRIGLQGWLILFLLSSNCALSREPHLTAVTEELAPLQMDVGLPRPTGAMVDVVDTVMTGAGYSHDIRLFPWARTYQLAQHQNNTLIFSILRTNAREDLFQWVGILFNAPSFLVKLKSRKDLTADNLEQVRKHFNIGAVRHDLTHHYLLNKQFVSGENILLSNSYDKLWELLEQEKVDFILANEFMWSADNPKYWQMHNKVEKLFVLHDYPADYYLAASQQTSKEIVKNLTKSLENLRESGQYQAILKKWHLK